MSDADIRQRLAAATEGPWEPYFTVHGDPFVLEPPHRFPFNIVANVSTHPDDYGRANAELMAHAPADVAALLAGVDRLRAAGDALAAALEDAIESESQEKGGLGPNAFRTERAVPCSPGPWQPTQPPPTQGRRDVPLLNYTTTVPVARTLAQVQGLLIEAGARSIMANYDNVGRPTSVAFAVETLHGMRTFSLPVNANRVQAVLVREGVQPRYSTDERAERVAWRIVKDWLEAQLAIIRTEMVTLDQVMLPYMHGDDGRTVYELYRDQQLALPSGPTP